MAGTYDYKRRPTVSVMVGDTPLGGENPVRIQSMATVATTDEAGGVAQAKRLFDAGAEYVRFTAQGVREAESLGRIRQQLREQGVSVPLVADIHFNPAAAFAAAENVEKVRINPGNFVDPGRTFKQLTYSDEEYVGTQLARIEAQLEPFLEKCRKKGTAVRIGVNHGSLSDRIMSRYGDTPAGMVESAMEFLRVCRKHDFHNVVISVKASNVTVMVETVRRMVRAMDAEDMHYPLHLGVTEAGDGEDGRVKSAVGIGTLLAEGIGDTIRVSLSEDPVNELPVARELVEYVSSRVNAPAIGLERTDVEESVEVERRHTYSVGCVGGENVSVVAVDGTDSEEDFTADRRPDLIIAAGCCKEVPVVEVDAEDVAAGRVKIPAGRVLVMGTRHKNYPGMMRAAFDAMKRRGEDNPVIIKVEYGPEVSGEQAMVRAGADCGALLLSGLGDGVMVNSTALGRVKSVELAFGILQSTRQRMTRTEYISCPGCGRTLFDLQSTLAAVKKATTQLKGLKIGVMGCIVNGPGEMADADYGYVGAGVGKVSLYRGKECVRKNIAVDEAIDALIELIKEDGRWNG